MNAPLFKHEAVLLKKILTLLPPSLQNEYTNLNDKTISSTQKKWMLDATFGAGGHTQAILKEYSSVSVIALDCDSSAIEWGKKNIKPHFPKQSLNLIHANFHSYSDLTENCFSLFLKNTGFDIIIVDLGVSSPQLDQAERGFSFYKEGPLDMRMDRTKTFLARDIINSWSETKLTELFYSYGEIYKSARVVKAIIKQRKRASLETTKQLADLIVNTQGWKKKGFHPATPYFLALRLKVNEELKGLKQSLPKMISSLNKNGRIFVLSFHSLEDRIVKNIFKNAHKTEGYNLTKKVILPSREEIKRNPRSRSAKLRVFERI
ncbi:MAG: 16S rRNA (cytosine(1402)-N(4))-methyltransferase RsmH [Bdellovibrionaceae bacterium]|nr:16S rRNA (cytosine(1402)-N(4))-methyltransferase RsmH [Pseudobdellovibrionaceae bacterium]